MNVDMGHTEKTRMREATSKPHMKLLHSDETIQTTFEKKLGSLLDSEWPLCTSAEEKWEKLVSCIQRTTEETIPKVTKVIADWFVEKEHVIRPELEKQNTLRKKWLTSETVEDKHTYLKQKSAIQRMLLKIKNHGYQMKATEIECAMRGSGNSWKSIR